MKILFVSRAYPPVTGGIENQNYAISAWLGRITSLTTVANRHGKKALPFFVLYAAMRALFTAHRYDVILLGDGVLAVVGFLVKLLYPKKPVVSIIHGLDILYTGSLYQVLWVKRFIPSLDGIIAVSQETRAAAAAKNIPEEKITVIPNGIDSEELQGEYTRTDLERLLGEDLTGKSVLLTVGRLARRKGAAWFIREVLPRLPKTTLYIVAGSGPEEGNIRSAMHMTETEDRVRMLGRLTDVQRNILLHTSDIFIQPNIRVPGDMEGFGIAVIEATACRRPVIASDLEGLKDAIRHNENGILVEPENPEAFEKAVLALLRDSDGRRALGERAHDYSEAHYHWNIIAQRYIEALTVFIGK